MPTLSKRTRGPAACIACACACIRHIIASQRGAAAASRCFAWRHCSSTNRTGSCAQSGGATCVCAPVRQGMASQPHVGHRDALLEAPDHSRLPPNRPRRESARSSKSPAPRARTHARTHADTQAGAHAHASLHLCVLAAHAIQWSPCSCENRLSGSARDRTML